ncbi:cytochrome b/b6 domain-containing protein [Paenactinomyces guangxiensis]|uniref:Cytochrome b/b6 domain-containing protein n=1 Tax=Paenactinomyces guangxiensis TaxID=1490290 RepID=A0A7W1WRA3_9BACL|nr:cytochrome b/b6 domain-containing protein [Paenactinomyces guangxiensis]MBA4494633.1 cytochrome b/b6 domain-containing protein [Paenactinomyces guangxiensis]MBH8591604.1 cytochrome b/b6 domain-containing protein [Paenactinomyces guangxiensis]
MKWMTRFNLQEQILHWVVVFLFLILLTTGLCLYVDWMRSQLGSIRYFVRTIHHYAGLSLMIIPLLFIAVWHKSLAAFLREMTHWRQVELDWLKGKTKQAHKFNGGQKLNFLLVTIWMIGLASTGFFIWQQQFISNETREFLYSWHRLLFYLLTIQVSGHVFLATLYKPTRHALFGIICGKVKRSWASKHHSLWLKEGRKEDANADFNRGR